MSRVPWDFGDLDGYIREGEPGRTERADNWQTAIGLQAVDGLAIIWLSCVKREQSITKGQLKVGSGS